MAINLRKRIKLFAGVYLNISKTGISLSVSKSGGTLNFGKKGIKGTVSLKGTGISYSTVLVKPEVKEDE